MTTAPRRWAWRAIIACTVRCCGPIKSATSATASTSMARIKCSKCGQRDYETVVLGAEREARKLMAEYI
jgi:hypothetical protein